MFWIKEQLLNLEGFQSFQPAFDSNRVFEISNISLLSLFQKDLHYLPEEIRST